MSIKEQYYGFLNSHSLWTTPTATLPIYDFILPQKNEPTTIHLQVPENEILGKRVEFFFEYYIRSLTYYEVLQKGLQIFDHKTTIGELDFLIKNKITNQLIHVELVYKFYLYVPEISPTELEKWIGPNKKDSLPLKIKKLSQKQLPLLYNDLTVNTLLQLGIETENIQQNVCFLGNLFIPLSYKNKFLPVINNQCIVGYWIYPQEFTKEIYASHSFYIPQKKEWTIHPSSCNHWFSFGETLITANEFLSQKKSPLLWMKSRKGIYTRFFMVWW